MNSGVKCVFCGTSTPDVPAAESAWVHSDVMEFSAEAFTVWRCASAVRPTPSFPLETYPLTENRLTERYFFFSATGTFLIIDI